jgi:hypothetical protein
MTNVRVDKITPRPAVAPLDAAKHPDERALSRALVAAVVLLATIPLALSFHFNRSDKVDTEVAILYETTLNETSSEYTRVVKQENEAAAVDYETRYPDDISPPTSGMVFPTRVTPLSPDLASIPPFHHRYIDHAYAIMVEAIHARLIIHQAAHESRPPHSKLRLYLRETIAIKNRWEALEPPVSLRAFHNDIFMVLELQRIYYADAIDKRKFGYSTERIQRIPEGIQTNEILLRAWQRLEIRFTSLSPEDSSALRSHLKAMHVF